MTDNTRSETTGFSALIRSLPSGAVAAGTRPSDATTIPSLRLSSSALSKGILSFEDSVSHFIAGDKYRADPESLIPDDNKISRFRSYIEDQALRQWFIVSYRVQQG